MQNLLEINRKTNSEQLSRKAKYVESKLLRIVCVALTCRYLHSSSTVTMSIVVRSLQKESSSKTRSEPIQKSNDKIVTM